MLFRSSIENHFCWSRRIHQAVVDESFQMKIGLQSGRMAQPCGKYDHPRFVRLQTKYFDPRNKIVERERVLPEACILQSLRQSQLLCMGALLPSQILVLLTTHADEGRLVVWQRENIEDGFSREIVSDVQDIIDTQGFFVDFKDNHVLRKSFFGTH